MLVVVTIGLVRIKRGLEDRNLDLAADDDGLTTSMDDGLTRAVDDGLTTSVDDGLTMSVDDGLTRAVGDMVDEIRAGGELCGVRSSNCTASVVISDGTM